MESSTEIKISILFLKGKNYLMEEGRNLYESVYDKATMAETRE